MHKYPRLTTIVLITAMILISHRVFLFGWAVEPTSDDRITSRESNLRHVTADFDFPVYSTLEEWQAKSEYIKQHVLTSAGLQPMPTKTALNAQVFGLMDYGDYTIEKVYFEAYPGFYVCGNLYRPKGQTGPFPGIICPHGHWDQGRSNDDTGGYECSVPGRCINFARQGYVAFTYDNVAYYLPDSRSDTGTLAQLPEHNLTTVWTQEELWGISAGGGFSYGTVYGRLIFLYHFQMLTPVWA